MSEASEPTAEQCKENAPFTMEGREGIACWYPQMGGYVSRCVIVSDGGCFDAFVWHDGEFPFNDGQQPRRLHHCDARQFIDFGELAETLSAWVMHIETGLNAIEIIPCRTRPDGTVSFTPTRAGTVTGPYRADEC